MSSLSDIEEKIGEGQPLTPGEAQRVASVPELPAVGALGEAVRKALHGDRVTFVRVFEVSAQDESQDRGEAGEVRLVGAPQSIDEARARVREGARLSPGVPLTGFSLTSLVQLVQGDQLALADLALTLKHEGLESVADAALDELGDLERATEIVRAVMHGGLGVWRATITAAPFTGRVALIERAVDLQRETGAFKALAPLPAVDPADQPSTGYDDVRTIAIARLMCRTIPSIQVDWRLYGPKLAQVAIAYGADDIDRVAGVAAADLGPRRSPREEIERHIRAAFAEPVERDGRYETRR
jgi:aminodeoxyfutalosine synthase